MKRPRYVTLRWIARNLPWVWRHVISAPTRIAWAKAAADQDQGKEAVARLDAISKHDSTEDWNPDDWNP